MADLQDGLMAAVEASRADLAELAADLVRLDTTARMPGEPARMEADFQDLIARRLRAVGAEVEVFEPEPASIERWSRQLPRLDFDGRPQLIARWPGQVRGRSLILNGHIDAVSTEPKSAWTFDPLGGAISEGRVLGRGASDMKGGIAAMIVAAEVAHELAGDRLGDLIVNTVTDEESSGAGTLACIAHGLRADAAIVPEPTNFDVWVGCRGSLTPTITVRGRPGHAELPQPHWNHGGAVNAIEKMLPLLEAVARLRGEWASRPDQQHRFFAPGTIVPVLIEGGEWFVTYPALCRLTCELMYLPQNADQAGEGRKVQREVSDWFEAAAAADPWLRLNPHTIEWGSDIPPAELPPEHPLPVSVLESARAAGLASGLSGFNSWFDGASLMRVAGTPSVAFGPPSLAGAHAVDESVAIDDLVRCAQALAIAIVRWGGSAAQDA